MLVNKALSDENQSFLASAKIFAQSCFRDQLHLHASSIDLVVDKSPEQYGLKGRQVA